MEAQTGQLNVLDAWRQIPADIETIVASLSDDDLEFVVEGLGLSVKETVHHLVEANIVASSMIIAALGASGANYDWSWLWPNKQWCDRLGYVGAPIEPALETLRGLTAHISGLVDRSDDAMARVVWLLDSPDAEKYSKTVAEIIKQEVDHAAEHLGDVRKMLENG